MKNLEKVEALRISLHDWDVGVLTHYAGGKNILTFHPEFVAMPERERPIVTLRQKFDTQYLQRSQIKTEKIPPLLSRACSHLALHQIKIQASRSMAL